MTSFARRCAGLIYLMQSKIKKYTDLIYRWLKRSGLRAALITGIIIILAQAILLLLNQVRPDHTVLGLKFENNSVQSLSIDGLHGRVKTILDMSESRPVLVRTGKFQIHVTARQLGAIHNSNVIEQGLLSVGRQGRLWHRRADHDSSALGKRNLKIGFSKTSRSLASAFLTKINHQTKIAANDAGLDNQ